MRRKSYLIVFLAVMALIMTAGCARTPEQRAAHFVEHMADKLKLDEPQKERLETIKEEFMEKRQKLIASRKATIDEANALMRSTTIDQARLGELVKKNEEQAAEMVHFLFAKFSEIHDMLTPEQREKLVSRIEHYTESGGQR